MIKRIVQLTFAAEHIDAFLQIFEESKQQIRRFPGCLHLELWQVRGQENIFMTYSHWESEADLEYYRHSELFKTTWARTKLLFTDKPRAWSVDLKSGPVPSK